MARIKFGSIVTAGAGSLGGHTFQHSRGGAQLRTKPVNKKKPSFEQSLIRSYNPKLQAGWRNLSDSDRSVWLAFADSYKIENAAHTGSHLSAHSLWMKYQYLYVMEGRSFQLNPLKAIDGPLGPELITNGSFDGPDNWNFQGSWSYAVGSALYSGSGIYSISQSVVLTSGTVYQLSFRTFSASATPYMWIFDQGAAYLFCAPYQTYRSVPEGLASFDVTCCTNAVGIRLYARPPSGSFNITDISIREIL